MPRHVNISITGSCNLACRYCFYADSMTGLQDLPTASWVLFFSRLSQMGVFDVTLSGGEPFARPDLFDLIDSLIANHMRYSFLTNGTLIDESMLKKLSMGKRQLRLNSIQVSIDGSNAAIHNQSRPDSFDRALNGLKLLKKNGFPVTVRVTVNRRNIHDLENIARLLLDEIGLSSFGTNEAMPIGTGCRSEADMSLTPIEMMQTMAILGRLQNRYPGRIHADAGPLAKRRMYAEMMHARRTGEKTERWRMGTLSACGCFFSTIEILHDGTIVPCCMLPGLPLGNILHDDLTQIWRNHPQLQSLRRRHLIPMHSLPGCENCDWASYCNGSCPGIAHQLTGDVNRANPGDCFRRFLLATGARYALRT